MTKILTAFVIAILATSCGGYGGGSKPATPLSASNIRAYVQGDRLDGILTLGDTSSGKTATGNVTLTIGSVIQNPFGIDCREAVYSGALTDSAGTTPYSVRLLFYQDINNSFYECGKFNDSLGRYVFFTNTATTPNGIFLTNKSPVQVEDTTSGVMFFDDGTWKDCTETVIAIENITVPMGTYKSYKKSQSCSYSDGGVFVGTVWMVPSIFNLKESGVMDGIPAEFLVTSYSFN